MEALLQRIEEILVGQLHRLTLLLPYSEAGVLEILHKQAQVLSTEYTAAGVKLVTLCNAELAGRYRRFAVEGDS